MFGHDDKDDKKTDDEPMATHQEHVVQPMGTEPPDENLMGVGAITDEPVDDPVVAPTSDDDDGDIDKIVDEINADADSEDKPAESDEPDESDASFHESPTDSANVPSELLEVKKSALKELSPLLDELDQAPAEKLNILMMSIQASDDQSLIPNAFEMAKQIEDKKLRAEAMLDIINEINYFTKKN